MDPLSVTASVITLIQVSAQVTSSIFDFIQATRAADSRLSALHHELGVLGRFLGSVNKTLTECHPRHLALGLDEDLWRQCEVAVSDCDITLTDLSTLVAKINSNSRSGGFLRKGKLTVNLSIHEKDIINHRDKIFKSNSALQTIIAIVNVSLSLRSNASQELILDELDRLKTAIDYALKASGSSADGLPHGPGVRTDTDVSRHLKTLGNAARHFHSAASTAATTVRDGRGTVVSGAGDRGRGWDTMQSDNASINGVLLPAARARVETFIRESEENEVQSLHEPPRPGRRPASSVFPAEHTPRYGDEEDDEGDDEHKMLLVEGLAELARESIINHEFDKAEESLKMALDDVHNPSDAMRKSMEGFRTQLAVCYLLQRKLDLAEKLVRPMLKSKDADLISYNLLHAVSLAHLAKYNFEPALLSCTHVMKCKKRLLGDSHDEYQQALGLLAVIFDTRSDQKQGDAISAEVYRRKLSPDFQYSHPHTEVEYICRHPGLLRDVFGDSFPYPWMAYPGGASLSDDAFLPSPASPTCAGGGISSPVLENAPLRRSLPTIRHKVQQSEKLELDTDKEVVVAKETVPHVLIQTPEGGASEPTDAVSDESTVVPEDDTKPGISRTQSVPSRSLSRKLSRMLTTAIRRSKSSKDLENPEEELSSRQHDATASTLHPKSALSLRRKKSTKEKRLSKAKPQQTTPNKPDSGTQIQDPFHDDPFYGCTFDLGSFDETENETLQGNLIQPASVSQEWDSADNEACADTQLQEPQQQTVTEVSGSSDGAHGYSELDVNERVPDPRRKQQALTFIHDFHQLHGHYGPVHQQTGQTSADLGPNEGKVMMAQPLPPFGERQEVQHKSHRGNKANHVQMTLDESCYMNSFQQNPHRHALANSSQLTEETPDHHHTDIVSTPRRPPSSIESQQQISSHTQHITSSSLTEPAMQTHTNTPQTIPERTDTNASKRTDAADSGYGTLDTLSEGTISPWGSKRGTAPRRMDTGDSHENSRTAATSSPPPIPSSSFSGRGKGDPRFSHDQIISGDNSNENGNHLEERRRERRNGSGININSHTNQQQQQEQKEEEKETKAKNSPGGGGTKAVPSSSSPKMQHSRRSPSPPSRHKSSSSIQSDSMFFASRRRSALGGKREEEEDDDDDDEDEDDGQGVLL